MHYKIKLFPAVLQKLDALLRSERQTKIHRRLQCVRLRHNGSSNHDIARLLQVNSNTVTEWIKLYLDKGFAGLCHLRYEGRRPSRLDPHREAIKTYIRERMPSTLAQLNRWLNDRFGFTVEETWLSRYCKKNSLFPARRHALSRVRLPA